MAESTIGYLIAGSTVGSIMFLMAGGPLMRRTGPMRALQIGLALGAVGTLMIWIDSLVVLAFAMILVGLGYGPSSPAGTDVLQRYSPPHRRNLIFSIKQAGVPVGGMVAGLALPLIAGLWNWQACLIFAVLVVAITVAAMQPMRAEIDSERDPRQPVHLAAFLSWSNLQEPLRAVARAPAVWSACGVGACLALSQGSWFAFAVTMMVFEAELSLAQAGFLFAVMQGTGVFGRVALGHVSDRLGSGRSTMRIIGLLSGLTSFALAAVNPAWPFWSLVLLFAVAGVTVSSWNGVQIAEVARLSPKALLRETSSGATVLIFIGYVVGPAGFAVMRAVTGGFGAGLVVIGAVAMLTVFILAGREKPVGA